ncbi:MAG TPA: glycerol-3-phosphate 1-O-acyltransferase PlsY [Nitrospiria bacterium]|nr:glycerol-3-phosphate 1-O-acyltransferase PlsY [Nitrospiria bacterium]HUK56814.1 glycerol-3-phosphate 1-O-acyltransferase PlsY [Nitrospiria bacterium]
MNTPPVPAMLLGVLVGYLVGSIPFGVIFSRWITRTDPRFRGSRNIGFTNVLRTAGRVPAALTLLGDLGKGYLAVRFAQWLSAGESGVWLAGLAAVLGHNYSLFLRFKGGKGVATGLGVVYGIEPWAGWITIVIWGATVWIWRYSSLGAIAAFGSLPLIIVFLRPVSYVVVFSLILTGIILIRHTTNIQRLRAGTEPKIGRA